MSKVERFWKFVDKTPSCWLWTGYLLPHGYARLRVEGQMVYAHRISYELHVGEIPSGFQIDHLCRVRHCVNPTHLEAVPRRINMIRSDAPPGLNARKTHCVHDHEFTPENTYIFTARNGQPHRLCRQCRQAHHAAAYASRRAKKGL